MNEKTGKAVKSIGRSISNINKQIKKIKEEYPDAVMYLEDGRNFNVLSGESHSSDALGEPNQDRIIKSFELHNAEAVTGISYNYITNRYYTNQVITIILNASNYWRVEK